MDPRFFLEEVSRMPGSPVAIQTISAAPITRGDTTITPQMQVLLLHIDLPISRGRVGFNRWWGWRRPSAVIVQTAGDPPQRIPILDLTRLIQIGLFGFALIFMIVLRRRNIR
jgi:hypothetical protein